MQLPSDFVHGASLKDLGKKWFAFTKLNADSIIELLREVMCSFQAIRGLKSKVSIIDWKSLTRFHVS